MLEKRSHFLLGPRQTGKTFLIRHTLKNARVHALLDTSLDLALSHHPGRMAQELTEEDRWVVVDEIQRLPELPNEVHRLIETRGIRFLLTGSSARKLRRGGVNLLGGRARTKYLRPLTYHELRGSFDLARALSRGLLPSIYFSDDPRADLEAYAGSYLQQEILAEGLTRNIPLAQSERSYEEAKPNIEALLRFRVEECFFAFWLLINGSPWRPGNPFSGHPFFLTPLPGKSRWF